ncbi:TPA: hypothetical protein HA351_05725 [Methanosarcinaceae archaeon]|nr:hypothetical protein [Methanosarcinaceae archaeon]
MRVEGIRGDKKTAIRGTGKTNIRESKRKGDFSTTNSDEKIRFFLNKSTGHIHHDSIPFPYRQMSYGNDRIEEIRKEVLAKREKCSVAYRQMNYGNNFLVDIRKEVLARKRDIYKS